jgi:hypothetical protein
VLLLKVRRFDRLTGPPVIGLLLFLLLVQPSQLIIVVPVNLDYPASRSVGNLCSKVAPVVWTEIYEY